MLFTWEELYTAYLKIHCLKVEIQETLIGCKHPWETPPKYFHRVCQIQNKICNSPTPFVKTISPSSCNGI